MSDILANRTGALDRLLAELDVPPPVPPKDDHRPVGRSAKAKFDALPKITLSQHSQAEFVAHDVQAAGSSSDDIEIISESEDAMPQRSTNKKVSFSGVNELAPLPMRRKKTVTFAQVDDEDGFSEINSIATTLVDESSVHSFQPAARQDRSPQRGRDGQKKKPAPLNLNRPTSHTGKWKVHTPNDLWTPIDDEPNTAAMIAMDVAPKICPLPYKPVKSVPLKSKRSLRPAPLRVRKTVRFDSMKSPAHLPLKSPGLAKKGVRFDVVKSPAVARFRTPSTPYSNTQFQVLTPGRKRGVRFDSVKSPAASSFKMPPTPFTQDSFEDEEENDDYEDEDDEDVEDDYPFTDAERKVRFDAVKSPARSHFKTPPTPYFRESFEGEDEDSASSIEVKRQVRFDTIKSPARSRFKTPLTPYNKATFGIVASRPKRGVRFASLKSPAASSFKIPPTPYNKASFRVSSSPPDFSPVTPRAMHMTIPAIEPNSPELTTSSFRPASAAMDDIVIRDTKPYGIQHPPSTKGVVLPPRTTSLHHRKASLPNEVRGYEEKEQSNVPSMTFDEGAVGASTLRWLGMLPKTSYRVGQENVTDRNKILGSYFS